jgi:hypothetical protein
MLKPFIVQCQCCIYSRVGGQEQLTSNGGRFKPPFAEKDKKQTMKDLRRISSNWFKNQLYPFKRLSRLRALGQRARNDPYLTKFENDETFFDLFSRNSENLYLYYKFFSFPRII